MARPRIAIDAAVLAAAIGVDRAVEADIGRVVAGDDRARRVDAERRRRSGAGSSSADAPAVVERRPALRLSKRPLSLLAAPRPLRGLTAWPAYPCRDICRSDANISRTKFVIGRHPDAERGREPAGDRWRRWPSRRSSARSSSPMAARATTPSRSPRQPGAAGRRGAARPRHAARRRRRGGDGRLAAVSARRLPPRRRAGRRRSRAFIAAPGAAGRAGYFDFALDDPSAGGAAARTASSPGAAACWRCPMATRGC